MSILSFLKKLLRSGSYESFDRPRVKEKWQKIEELMQLGGESHFKQAIISADNLVDYILKSKTRGETMGERLKKSQKSFSWQTYDNLWKAHKVRNEIVHNSDKEILVGEARMAISRFERALRELRAL